MRAEDARSPIRSGSCFPPADPTTTFSYAHLTQTDLKAALGRFPADFMFHLSGEEAAALRSQCATSKTGRSGRQYAPYVFTEHGAIMSASVLNSVRAVKLSAHVVRAFVRLREMMSAKPVPRCVHARDAGWQGRNQYGVPRILRSIGFKFEEARPVSRRRPLRRRGRAG